jgi:hypothetical protein
MEVEMDRIIVSLKIHSFVDIITNSSTELFCEIESDTILPKIKEYLELILKREIEIFPSEEDIKFDPEYLKDESKRIQFEIERGDNDEITDDFCKLLDVVLTKEFGKENFRINNNVSY